MEWPDCLDPDSQSLPKPPEEWTQQQCEAVHAIVRATKKCHERDIKEAKARAAAEVLARAKRDAEDDWLWLLNLHASGSGSKGDEEGNEEAGSHEGDEEAGSHEALAMKAAGPAPKAMNVMKKKAAIKG